MFAALFALSTVVGSSQTLAKSRIDFEHAVNMAGQQRTLAQQIGKEAILVAMGIDKATNLKRLQASHAMFQRISKGLRNGDDELRLKPLSDPELIRHVDRVEQIWASVAQLLARGVAGDEMSAEEVVAVAEMTEPLYSVVDELVKALRQEAQKGMIVFSINLLAIDYSTRQSMLSQKLAKEFLLVAYGHSVEKNRKALARSSSHFDRVLKGLLDGDLQLRLRQAPTPAIRIELQKAMKIWTNVVPIVEGVANGQDVNDGQLGQISDLNLSLLQTIDSATELFEAL
ncbi:MAG: type IV pili methyl-accepting chemotaxis transducer N-terminal domain-containing protein [Kiloniellales bacterium]|nr:type IV pili methyl-accepting chemotaxis transducer N-terminal domain-containing protein [Kiloniellales bacterium]MDJ0969028.1 type IV pili methyl-accepting chemotaxis transducer N-terminal domain-containing protein [Kiloniellales bacterium]MDJ0980142.1 type IV pili methyl-accepting chemotaxis transducer N-terminal domain-containing protein [Kiloniellales bacterium]